MDGHGQIKVIGSVFSILFCLDDGRAWLNQGDRVGLQKNNDLLLSACGFKLQKF
jgi:hypothetical protein